MYSNLLCLLLYNRGTSSDEMCNLYIMYYMEAAHATSYMTCVRTGDPVLFHHIPEIANIPVPVSPDMVMMGHGSHKGTKVLVFALNLPEPIGNFDTGVSVLCLF